MNVCVTAGAGIRTDFETAKQHLQTAATAWENEARVKFDFRCLSSALSETKLVVTLSPGINRDGIGGTAGFGQATSQQAQITYCSPAMTGSQCGQTGADVAAAWAHFRYAAIHELGHVLGFAHEHQRVDTPDGLQCKHVTPAARGDRPADNGFVADGGNTLGTIYDPASVMNYCRDIDGDGRVDTPWDDNRRHDFLSAGDIAGVRAAYGPRRTTAVTVFTGVGFTGTSQALPDGIHESTRGDLPLVGDNRIRSMRVVAENVIVCANDGRSAELGLCRLFGPGDHASLGSDLDGRVSLVAALPNRTFVDGRVKAFEHGSSGGRMQQFRNGVHQAIRGDFESGLNDQFSSFEVEPGTRAIVCDNDAGAGVNGGSLGPCRLLSRSTSSMESSLNDTVSLVAVWKSWDAWLTNSSGVTQAFPRGTYEAAQGDLSIVGNDAAVRLNVSIDSRAILCDGDGYFGAGADLGVCRTYGAGIHLLPSGLAGRVSLLHVAPFESATGTQVTAAILHEDGNRSGGFRTVGAGMREATRGELSIGNDAISSLQVSSSFRAVVCDGDSFAGANGGLVGPCQYYPAGAHDSVGALNDRISTVALGRGF